MVDAHAVRFPFPKKERWYVILVATNAKDQKVVVAQEKLVNFQLRSVRAFSLAFCPRLCAL